MRATGLAWGIVVVMAYGAAAEAAPNAAAPQAGAAGAAATAPSTAPATPAPSPALVPGAPSPPDAAPPALDTTAPASPPADDGNATAEEQEEPDEEPPRRKRAHRRRARVLVAEPTEDEPEAPEETEVAPPPVASFRLAGPHFLLSIERITNLLSWSVTDTQEITDFNSGFGAVATTLELERSGTDVSFLGSGAASTTNVFSIPRIAFDGMFGNGLTLGGSLSYMVVSGKHEVSTDGTSKRSVDDGSASVFVFAPRIGVMIPASPFVGVWLRGGVSRISISRDVHPFDSQSGEQLASTVTSTLTLVDITLDPQLVLSPVPHVGITLGALLDLGVSGTAEMSGSTTTRDVKASSYGVSGGLVAIF